MIVNSVIVSEWFTTAIMLSLGVQTPFQYHRDYNEHKVINMKW